MTGLTACNGAGSVFPDYYASAEALTNSDRQPRVRDDGVGRHLLHEHVRHAADAAAITGGTATPLQ